jgi:predicted RNase H-like HicB family nuclease
MKNEKYSINIQWSDKDQVFFATVPEFPGLSAFGDTKAEALEEAETVLEDFIEIYEEDGNELPEPQKLQYASGQTRVRMPKTLHAKLRKEAVREGVSLNQQIVSLLIERLSVKEALTEIKKQLDSKAYAVKEQVVFNPEDVWSGGVLARSMVGSGSMSVTVKDVGIPKVQLTENRPDYIFKNIEHNN